MQPVRFGILTSVGSLVWIGSLAGISYSLGGQWHRLSHGFSMAGYGLAALVVLAIAGFVFKRWRHVRSERENPRAPGVVGAGRSGEEAGVR